MRNQECTSLTQAGTDTGGPWTRARILADSWSLSPSTQTTKVKAMSKEKGYDIDQNP